MNVNTHAFRYSFHQELHFLAPESQPNLDDLLHTGSMHLLFIAHIINLLECMDDRDAVAADCQLLIDELSDTAALDAKIAATQEEMENVVTLNKELIRTQAAKGTDPEEFNRKAAEYDERFRKAEARLARLQADRKRNLARCAEIRSFVNAIREQQLVIQSWDEQLWKIMVLQLTVYSDGRVVFTFRGENTVTVRAE